MKQSGGSEAAKRRAGESAAAAVEDGSVVGLGTGSTAAAAIRELGRRVDSGLDVRGIPTSHGARRLAREAGIPLTTLAEATPDVAIDGADQFAVSTSFSRAWAAPPPLMRSPSANWSAPSMARSGGASSRVVSGIPTLRASRRAPWEVGTPRTSRPESTRRPSS